MKPRGGHPFGLMQIPKNAKFVWVKWQKTWYTLSITYSINPRGCRPLGTTSLGQAVGPNNTANVLSAESTDECLRTKSKDNQQ